MSTQPTIVIGAEMSGPAFAPSEVIDLSASECRGCSTEYIADEYKSGYCNNKCYVNTCDKLHQAVKDLSCCDSNGDVRGMCFCCLGDLSKVTLKQIVALRKCPNLTYAVAFWLFNNFEVSEVRKDAPRLSTFWRKRRDIVQYLGLIIRDGDEFWALKKAIEAMEKDEDGRGGCEQWLD